MTTGSALVLGLPHEPPVAAVIRELARLGAPHHVVNQRKLVSGNVETWWSNGVAGGVIEVDGSRILLDDVAGVYTRLTSWSDLPEVAADPAVLDHAANMHLAIETWLETAVVRVLNRTSASDTNNSKPYQAMIIRDYFCIPATLVSNDPAAVLAFREEFGHIIYKSVSGERSIVASFANEDLDRLDLLASAPVQFQEFVDGVDVRVHVVGQDVFATCVESDAVDYRYDASGMSAMSAITLPDEVSAACVALTARLGLELSGIDLRYAEDGRIICFEVNPSPAFSVYEDATGQPMAAAIARRLTQRLP